MKEINSTFPFQVVILPKRHMIFPFYKKYMFFKEKHHTLGFGRNGEKLHSVSQHQNFRLKLQYLKNNRAKGQNLDNRTQKSRNASIQP